MKNTIRKTCTNPILLGVLVLLTYCGYGQSLRYQDREDQRRALEAATEELYRQISPNSEYSIPTTIAAMQIPDSNIFMISTNSPCMPPLLRNVEMIKLVLTNTGGFYETDNNGDPMEIILVSGAGRGTLLWGEDEKGWPVRYMELPGRTNPNNGKTLHVHAEMAMLSSLSIMYPHMIPSDDYVIQSSRPFCPRCFAYLKLNGFHVYNVANGVATDIIQSTFTSSWCVPNFNNKIFPYWVADWIREASIKYVELGRTNGIYDGAGKNILENNHRSIPESTTFDDEYYYECEE